MKKSDFDELFDAAFEKSAACLSDLDPDPTRAWEQVQVRMKELSNKRKFMKQVVNGNHEESEHGVKSRLFR